MAVSNLTEVSPTASSVREEEFAQCMARFAPFERAPELAVAVSGGADSMALCLLAHRWAASVGGTIHALTVNHNLRTAARMEAEQVHAWLSARGEGYAHAFENPRVIRAAIDRAHVRADAAIVGAREIAFFPPMTGG